MKNCEEKKGMLHSLRQPLCVTLVLLLICGFLFPMALTGLSALIFPKQSKGSLVKADGQVIGAEFVGQDFTEDYFMQGRPSAYNYNTYYEDEDGNQFYNDGSEFGGLSSGSSNYAASNPELVKRVEGDVDEFMERNPQVKAEDIPADMVTASGSGLDPHISPVSAKLQIPALAQASGLSESELQTIVDQNTKGKVLGVFGEEIVNVLGVNMDIAKAMGLVETVEK